MASLLPSLEALDRALSYDETTGHLIWKERTHCTVAGRVAGSMSSKGYIYVKVYDVTFPAHRIAWKLHYRCEPPPELDHIDRDKTNNRVANLRPASRSENCVNKGARQDNQLGVKGVRRLSSGRFDARIFAHGKSLSLGAFDSAASASAAFMAAAVDLHGPELALAPDQRESFYAFLQGLADADVRAGKREIPGFLIQETRVL